MIIVYLKVLKIACTPHCSLNDELNCVVMCVFVKMLIYFH